MTEPTGIEARVCQDITERQQKGIKKYGVSVANNPLELREWIQHAYEECLDQAVYLAKIREELDNIMTKAVMEEIDIQKIVKKVEEAFNK